MRRSFRIALFLFFANSILLIVNSMIADKVDRCLIGLSTEATTGLGIFGVLLGIFVFLKLSKPNPFARENLKYYPNQALEPKQAGHKQ